MFSFSYLLLFSLLLHPWIPVQAFARTILQACEVKDLEHAIFNQSLGWSLPSQQDIKCQPEHGNHLQMRKAGTTLDSSKYVDMGDSSSKETYKIYQELALRGYRLRVMPIPDFDISQTGSLLISNATANYRLNIQSVREDPVKIAKDIIGGAPFLDVFLALGREPPNSLLSMFVQNRVGNNPKQETIPYGFSLSADLGLLVVHSAYKAKDAGSPRENLFSEIMFRVWYEEVRGSVGNPGALNADDLKTLGRLKYIIHEDVENARTQLVINKIADLLPERIRQVEADDEVGTQPGFLITLNAASDNMLEQEAFNAVLGSENGRGVAYMMNQHSHVFGGKTVVQIRIFFYGNGIDNPCVLFRVARLRLPQENWKPPRLRYDPASSRSHLDAHVSNLVQRPSRQQKQGIDKTIESNWNSLHLGNKTSQVLAQSGKLENNTISAVQTTESNSTESTPSRRFRKRGPASSDAGMSTDGSESSGFDGTPPEYQLAASLGKDLIKIGSRPDVSKNGSTIIMQAENNYQIGFKAAVPLESQGLLSYLIAKYLGNSVLEQPIPIDRISVGNIMSGELEPDQNLYGFGASYALGVLVLWEINRLGDAGSPVESSVSEIFYRIWYEVAKRTLWGSGSAKTEFEKAEDLRLLSGVIIDNPQDADTLVVIDTVAAIIEEQGVSGRERAPTLVIENIVEDNKGIIFTARVIKIGQWEGEENDKDIDEFFRALVGCESGKAVAQMLQDHSEALGTKRIEEIYLILGTKIDGTNVNYIMYKLGLREPAGQEFWETWTPEIGRSKYDALTEAGANMRTDAKPRRPKDVSHGGSDLIMDKANGYQIDYTSRKWTITQGETDFIPYYVLTGNSPHTERKTSVWSMDDNPVGPAYRITHSREDGLLVISIAFKSLDRAYPKEQRFSEILYRVWFNEIQRKPTKSKHKLTNLEYIGADTIINQEFGTVARYIFRLHKESVNVKPILKEWGLKYLTFEASSEDPQLQRSFNALQATVFGRAISRMLYDHSSGLGRKEITQITIFYDTNLAHSDNRELDDPTHYISSFYALFKIEAPRTQTGGELRGSGSWRSKIWKSKSRGGKKDSDISRRAITIGNTSGELESITKGSRAIFEVLQGWTNLYSKWVDILKARIPGLATMAKLCKSWLL
ncbi:hypothetical protein TWF506_006921 [Arthrobotrys conoides]|uniref:Uncharacterized protein n=1 Tax=Arthrobotrys conoides TaxID=74498 RepID=A0AAN8NS42_9PEZI